MRYMYAGNEKGRGMTSGKAKQRSRHHKTFPKVAARRGIKRWEIAVIAGLAVLAAWGGWSWWHGQSVEENFLELAATGKFALTGIETPPETSSGHLSGGQTASYGERFPTSGAHVTTWVNPGTHDTVQTPAQLVHSLEHGMIVIYYDEPAGGDMAMLEDWASLYGGQWSGVVLAPAAGLGEEIVLTAWKKRLRLEKLNAPIAAAFIDRYRGRGPEKRVR